MQTIEMTSLIRKLTMMTAIAMLSACAHKDVKAPCADSDAPPTLSSYVQQSEVAPTSPFSNLTDHCGPLRPLNREH
jgi:hypothetical protein